MALLLNVNELLISLSKTLDFAEREVLPTHSNHGTRVAYISARIARKTGFSDRDLFDLISYALLHDNGVMASIRNARDSRQEPGANLQSAPLFNSADGFSIVEASPDHCVEGEKNLAHFPFIRKKDNVILYHHENYDGSGFFGVSGNNIPLYSRIIHLADSMSVWYSSGMGTDMIMDAIVRNVRLFDPRPLRGCTRAEQQCGVLA